MRIVRDTILSKVNDVNKPQEIELSQVDFWDSDIGTPKLVLGHIPELVIALENETDKRIRLIDTKIVETGEEIVAPNKTVPDPDERIRTDYYRVSYNPFGKEVNLGNPFYFYLSRTKGLYRAHTGEVKEIYPIQDTERFSILENLSKDFIETKILADMCHTTSVRLSAQIAGIKKQIEDTFVGIAGDDFIVSEQGKGYRLGDKVKLKIVA